MKKPTTDIETHAAEATAGKKWIEIVHLDLDKIKPSATNPRTYFDEETQEQLEQSMRMHGFTISALLVRPVTDSYYVDADEGAGIWHVMRKPMDGEAVPVCACASSREAAEKLKALGGEYELVCGERRWRAARAVGIVSGPAIVRNIPDNDAFIIQLIENIQRDNLTPIEEAEGYRRALDLKDAAGRQVYTVESLHKSVGKSTKTIWKMLRLCVLDGKTRQLVMTRKLSIETAVRIGRIGDERLRDLALKKILTPKNEEGPLSERRALALIHAEFICDLSGAPFDQEDAKLLAVELNHLGERCGGGACTDCPLKSGNAQVESDDLPSKAMNTCLNPGCFARKREAAWVAWQASVTDVGRSRRGLGHAECLRLFDPHGQLYFGSGLVKLSEHPDGNDLKPGVASPGTWKKLLGIGRLGSPGMDIEVQVARDSKGTVHELVDHELARGLAAKSVKGFKAQASTVTEESGEVGGGSTGAFEAGKQSVEEMKARLLNERQERETNARVLTAKISAVKDAVRETGVAPKISRDFWRLTLEALLNALETSDSCVGVALREGWNEDDEGDAAAWLSAQGKKMETPGLVALCVDLMQELIAWKDTQGALAPWAKLFGVNLKAVEKKTALEVAQELAAKRVVGVGMRWTSGPTLQEESFVWNENNVCAGPDELAVEFPKSYKIAVLLKVAQRGGKWYGAYEAAVRDKGVGGPVKPEGRGEDSWLAAVIEEAYGVREFFTQNKVDQKAVDVLNAYIDTLNGMNRAVVVGSPSAKKAKRVTAKGVKGAKKKSGKKGGAK